MEQTIQNNQKQHTSNPLLHNHQEEVLVVKRTKLFELHAAWHGVHQQQMNQFLELIEQEQQFIPRAQAEVDPTYKQIIPYLIFSYQHTYFLMQRTQNCSDQRLKNKFSLGIGGHIRKEDMKNHQSNTNSIIAWAQREFAEEIQYKNSYTVQPLGMVNDDTNAVGEVHLGFAFLLTGDSPDITVKSELKSGELVTRQHCQSIYNKLESWSQLIVDILPQ